LKFTFDGSNGEEIAEALMKTGRSGSHPNRPVRVEVSSTHSGPGLSLARVYPDGQVAEDTWRVPVGFTIDAETGEVRDAEDRVWAHEDLVEL
jgi:hypothetical protein